MVKRTWPEQRAMQTLATVTANNAAGVRNDERLAGLQARENGQAAMFGRAARQFGWGRAFEDSRVCRVTVQES